jgi:hypothetical protein
VSRGIQQLIARPTTPPSRLHHGSMAAARTNQATMLERASYTSSVAVTRNVKCSLGVASSTARNWGCTGIANAMPLGNPAHFRRGCASRGLSLFFRTA